MKAAAKFAYEAGRQPRVASFGVRKTPLMEVNKAIAKTCPEALASVWRGCHVEKYKNTKAMERGAVAAQITGGADRAFLAADRSLNVLEFENDYSMAELMPLPRGL